ncbi:MAG: Fic family protein [Candidatus Marinimicrobia bacterium]|nr:Fic family protein [Candidatus Neomarinimicrobiota bacterium]
MFKATSERAGKFLVQQSGENGFSAFIPKILPPSPPLKYDDELLALLVEARGALGRLDGATSLLPNPDLFLFMFVRKEAVLSSQIEGTQASLSELIEYEDVGKRKSNPDDVQEVSNYVKAMDYGIARLETLPLSLRLIREIHAKLLEGTRGGNKTPGRFRSSQNWIGGTRPSDARFVPPPPQEVINCMGDLELFLQNKNLRIPALIKAGLGHAQFETIHPFLDGNGRVGRLLITLILIHEKVLEKPLLYLSLYFKKYRDAYYDHLNAIRRDGDWEGWLKFYLRGVSEISIQAVHAAHAILKLQEIHRKRILQLGKASFSAMQLFDLIFQKPKVTVNMVSRELSISLPTARKAIQNLEKLAILKETSGKQRDREYLYEQYFDIILSGIEDY